MNIYRNGVTAPDWLWDCCSRDRVGLMAPFSCSTYSYATDGRILVRVAKIHTVPMTENTGLLQNVTGIMEKVDVRFDQESVRPGWCMPDALPYDTGPEWESPVQRSESLVMLQGHRFRTLLVKRMCALPITALNVTPSLSDTVILLGVGIGVRAVLKPLISKSEGPLVAPSEVQWRHVAPL